MAAEDSLNENCQMAADAPEPGTEEFDRMLREVRHETAREHAFIDGYGAALQDMHDDDVDLNKAAMTQGQFAEHLRDRWEEFK